MIRAALATLGLVGAWGALVALVVFEGWGRAPLAARGDLQAFAAAARARIGSERPGNAVLLLLQDGRVRHVEAFGVEPDGVFQVASLSKWITAWGVLALVEEGRLALDAPVGRWLTRWRLPAGGFDPEGVTVRRLLSHTAGLADDLGYEGFAPGEPVQSLEASLTRAADAAPHADGTVALGHAPGSRWRYSGGGYTLLQLLVEEATGERFAAYMQRAVLAPLGMRRSTFDAARAERMGLAPFFDVDGTRAPPYRYAALAAASLYTTAPDLARFLQAHLPGPDGAPVGRGVLAPETVAAMRTPHAWRWGRPIWGLGTILYAPDGAGGFVFGHEGRNRPAINTSARLDPATGAGIVVLETGRPDLATRLAGEWVFWETGNVGLFLLLARLERAIVPAAAGAVAIVAAGALLAWRRGRRARCG